MVLVNKIRFFSHFVLFNASYFCLLFSLSLAGQAIFFEVLDGTGTITFNYATNSNKVAETAVAIPGATYNVNGNPVPPYNATLVLNLPSVAASNLQGTIQVFFFLFYFRHCIFYYFFL
jgi:hypothetical protein